MLQCCGEVVLIYWFPTLSAFKKHCGKWENLLIMSKCSIFYNVFNRRHRLSKGFNPYSAEYSKLAPPLLNINYLTFYIGIFNDSPSVSWTCVKPYP